MLTTYRTIKQSGFDQLVINQSTFIGYAKPVETEEEALAFIQTIKQKHRDATHNVTAYVLGEQNEIQRCNDDGEPAKTAGVPVLEVLKKEDLRDVALVVTRYFGGVKLGAGGLIRAYTKGARIGLEAAKIITKTLHQEITVTIDYPALGMMQNQLHTQGYLLDRVDYDESVHLQVLIAVDRVEDFKEKCIQWTNARCILTVQGYRYLES